MQTGKAAFEGEKPIVKIEAPKVKMEAPVVEVPLTTEQVRAMTGITEEREKYLKCWAVDDYRRFSPGEESLPYFMEAYPDCLDPNEPDMTLTDWGCGTGRASRFLHEDAGFDVTAVDFAINCLDDEVRDYMDNEVANPSFRFVEHDITKKIKQRSYFGYCCDVMEHLPPEQVDDALEVILENSRHVFFQIATTEDHFGKHPDIQHPLHLSVHGYQWWLKKLVSHGCVIHRSVERPGHVIFFVTGYTGFSYDKMTPNTEVTEIWQNMKANAEWGYPGISAYEEQADVDVVLLCGGPSLNDQIEDINKWRIRRMNGKPVHFVTMNGSYHWARDQGLWPVTQFMLDAREFNNRFVEPASNENIYIIASQCHPSVFAKLVAAEVERAYTWQVNITQHSIPVIEENYGTMYEDWVPCPGGSTVLLRVLPQLQQMGFRKIHLYGFDSCVMGEEHHAYEQKENDVHPGSVIPITPEVEGEKRTFMLHPWMIAQAKEFFDMKDTILRHLNMTVYGDGLIAYLMEHGADVLKE